MITIRSSLVDGRFVDERGVPLYGSNLPKNIGVQYGLTETVVYEPGDKLPEATPSDPGKELSIDERLARIEQTFSAELGLEFVEGDDPTTPETEKGYWRKLLGALGIK